MLASKLSKKNELKTRITKLKSQLNALNSGEAVPEDTPSTADTSEIENFYPALEGLEGEREADSESNSSRASSTTNIMSRFEKNLKDLQKKVTDLVSGKTEISSSPSQTGRVGPRTSPTNTENTTQHTQNTETSIPIPISNNHPPINPTQDSSNTHFQPHNHVSINNHAVHNSQNTSGDSVHNIQQGSQFTDRESNDHISESTHQSQISSPEPSNSQSTAHNKSLLSNNSAQNTQHTSDDSSNNPQQQPHTRTSPESQNWSYQPSFNPPTNLTQQNYNVQPLQYNPLVHTNIVPQYPKAQFATSHHPQSHFIYNTSSQPSHHTSVPNTQSAQANPIQPTGYNPHHPTQLANPQVHNNQIPPLFSQSPTASNQSPPLSQTPNSISNETNLSALSSQATMALTSVSAFSGDSKERSLSDFKNEMYQVLKLYVVKTSVMSDPEFNALKAMCVKTRLTGSALRMVSNLPEEVATDLQALIAALQERFSPPINISLVRNELATLEQGDLSVSELEEKINILANKYAKADNQLTQYSPEQLSAVLENLKRQALHVSLKSEIFDELTKMDKLNSFEEMIRFSKQIEQNQKIIRARQDKPRVTRVAKIMSATAEVNPPSPVRPQRTRPPFNVPPNIPMRQNLPPFRPQRWNGPYRMWRGPNMRYSPPGGNYFPPRYTQNAGWRSRPPS